MRMSALRPVALFMIFFSVLPLLAPGMAKAGSTMPSFSLPDAVTNTMVDSAAFAGKAKLVVFFATWCMPCMQEVPTLKSLQAEYGDDAFSVIAISVDERQANVVSFIEKNNINYPVLMFDRRIIADFGGIPGLPTTFLVDKDDAVLKKYPGLVPHALLEREVKRLLGLAGK